MNVQRCDGNFELLKIFQQKTAQLDNWALLYCELWLLQRSKLSLHRCTPVENQKVSAFKVIRRTAKLFFGYYGYHSLTWSRLVSSRCLKCWMVWCLSLCRALSNFCKHFCTRWVLGVFSLRAFKKEKNNLWIFLSIVKLKFRYSEKATKIGPFFHSFFDITYLRQFTSGRWAKFLWPSQRILILRISELYTSQVQLREY